MLRTLTRGFCEGAMRLAATSWRQSLECVGKEESKRNCMRVSCGLPVLIADISRNGHIIFVLNGIYLCCSHSLPYIVKILLTIQV